MIQIMNTCSFTINLEKINVCSKVLVECIIYFGKLDKASSCFQLAPLTFEASPNNKKLKENLH